MNLITLTTDCFWFERGSGMFDAFCSSILDGLQVTRDKIST